MYLQRKLKIYYVMVVLSLVFAVIGFSYNAWRLEVTEDNSNVRTASFELLKNLAELEQIIYALHYDKNETEGSPRKGWVKVQMMVDLSTLVSKPVEAKSQELKETWSGLWPKINADMAATDKMIESIDAVRAEIKHTLKGLK